jgi:hypothetical protein
MRDCLREQLSKFILLLGLFLLLTGCRNAMVFDTEGTKIDRPETELELKMSNWNNK